MYIIYFCKRMENIGVKLSWVYVIINLLHNVALIYNKVTL